MFWAIIIEIAKIIYYCTNDRIGVIDGLYCIEPSAGIYKSTRLGVSLEEKPKVALRESKVALRVRLGVRLGR